MVRRTPRALAATKSGTVMGRPSWAGAAPLTWPLGGLLARVIGDSCLCRRETAGRAPRGGLVLERRLGDTALIIRRAGKSHSAGKAVLQTPPRLSMGWRLESWRGVSPHLWSAAR